MVLYQNRDEGIVLLMLTITSLFRVLRSGDSNNKKQIKALLGSLLGLAYRVHLIANYVAYSI